MTGKVPRLLAQAEDALAELHLACDEPGASREIARLVNSALNAVTKAKDAARRGDLCDDGGVAVATVRARGLRQVQVAVLRHLKAGPASVEDIADVVDRPVAQVKQCLQRMLDEVKEDRTGDNRTWLLKPGGRAVLSALDKL